jgi:cysteine desulfurase
MTRLATLRNQLKNDLDAQVGDLELCGPALDAVDDQRRPLRLPGNLNVAFPRVDGEALIMNMKNLAVSSGATCSSTDPGPSHVLLALGLSEDLARSTLRFGLGRFTTEEDVQLAAQAVAQAVASLRRMA